MSLRVAILAKFPQHAIPEIGGQFPSVHHFATWLPQLSEAYAGFDDLEVHWVMMSVAVEAPLTVRWKNQTFHVLPTQRGRVSSLYRQDRRAIRARLDVLAPDVVHGWGNEDVYGWAAATSGRPNVVSVQGILSHYILRNLMPSNAYFQALLELYVLYKADVVTTESTWGRQVLLRRNPWAKVSLVEYGAAPIYHQTPWEPDADKPVAIFIGSTTPRKGIQDAVAAFRDPALAHAELWVLGDGDAWAEKLRATAPANVKWLGRVSSRETADYLRRAWCLVLPTRADTSPNVVKEARAVGLPVVSTPCGGQTMYIEDGKNGFLVAPGDIKALSANITRLLENLEITKAWGAYQHEEHRRLLDPMETANKFYRIYKELLDFSTPKKSKSTAR